MRPPVLMLGIVVCLVAGAARAGATPAGVTRCGSQSIGPGSIARRTGGGARCLLAAYRDHCRPARYELGIFGVDTIATRDFSLVESGGRCQVTVRATFRVVPQSPRPTARGTCRALRAVGSDVVATGCRGPGLASTVSLTGGG